MISLIDVVLIVLRGDMTLVTNHHPLLVQVLEKYISFFGRANFSRFKQFLADAKGTNLVLTGKSLPFLPSGYQHISRTKYLHYRFAANLEKFTSLSVSSLSLPSDYAQLTQLRELSLSVPPSPLGSLPPVVYHMPNLVVLKLLSLEIIYPPRQIHKLSSEFFFFSALTIFRFEDTCLVRQQL